MSTHSTGVRAVARFVLLAQRGQLSAKALSQNSQITKIVVPAVQNEDAGCPKWCMVVKFCRSHEAGRLPPD